MSLFHDVLNIRCNDENVNLTSSGESGKMSVKMNDDDIDSDDDGPFES